MTDALPYLGHRFGGRPEPVERDNPEPMEPDTEEEYLARKKDARHVEAVLTCLILIRHHMNEMSEFARDELDGRLPNIPYLDLPDDIKGATECRRKLETGIKAYEART